MSACPLCRNPTNPSLSVNHRKCGHSTCVDCFPKHQLEISYKFCPECLGQVAAPVVEEPVPHDGIDYVKNPGNKPSVARGVLSSVTSLVKRTEKKSLTPGYDLLVKRVPLATMMDKPYCMGLQHLLKEGVDIRDFLDNGYTWADLKGYADFNRGYDRACETLMALDVRATDLRDSPGALPAAQLRADLGLKSADFCLVFGLAFPEMGSLACDGDKEWTAQHCVNFGLTIEDLADFGSGMQFLEQYEDLLVGIPKAAAEEAQKKLGVTKNFLLGLRDLTAEEEAARQKAEEEEEEERQRRILEEEEHYYYDHHNRGEEEEEEIQQGQDFVYGGMEEPPRRLGRERGGGRHPSRVDRAIRMAEFHHRTRNNNRFARHGRVKGNGK